MKEFSNRPPRAGKPRFSRGPRTEEVRAPKRPTLDITLAQAFTDMGLATELVQAVADLGYTAPTKVQEAAIPRSLNRGDNEVVDLLVSSQTGSGKTAAFLLPVLHIILQQQEAERAEKVRLDEAARAAREAALAAQGQDADAQDSAELLLAGAKPKADKRAPRSFEPATPGALVLCPTRELAQQVARDAIDLVAHCRGLRVASVVGGTSYVHQLAGLRNADVVVATPGRLLDLQKSGQIRLDKVQYLVVDEADRMLDLGFAEDLADVHALTKDRAQTMMFSATFAPRVQQLAMRVMRKTERIELSTPEHTHDNIEQRLYWADNAFHKRKLLDHFLRDTEIKQAIVFSSTQIECDSLAEDLQQDGFSAVALHGALGQAVRNRRLASVRDGTVQILVATDVAARGLDVPTITHVFNFGLPMKAEDYTHRIGRTGRAGRQGLAITLAEFRDQRRIFAIEAFTRKRFEEKTVEGMEPSRRPSIGAGGGGNDRRGNGGPRRNAGGFGGSPGFGGNRGGNFGGGRREGGGGFAPRSEGFQGRSEPRFDPRFEGRPESRSDGRSDGRFEGRPARRFDNNRPDTPGGRPFEGRSEPRSEGRADPRFADRGSRFDTRAPRPESRGAGAPPRGHDDRRAAPARSAARR